MKRYDKYEDWKEVISKNSPQIPNYISSEWLQNNLLDRKSYFRNWGFCFENLSNCKFEENINYNIIRKVPFSTKTIFPKENPFVLTKDMFLVDDNVRKLHEEGINGEGINVAVIDFAFDTIHDELKECLVYQKNCRDDYEVHFHGSTVATQLCGKNLGVAPNVNLWFYGTGQGAKRIIVDNYKALKDIYEQNKKGANIKIINISGSRHRENSEYMNIYKKLLDQGCYIIDSLVFGDKFTSINQDPITKDYYYSDGQVLGMEQYKYYNHIAIPTGGKMTPLVTTTNEYLYCGQATYSWAIPKLSGYFALALQVNNNLTYEEFEQLAIETAKKINGIKIFNIIGIIKKIKQNMVAYNKISY